MVWVAVVWILEWMSESELNYFFPSTHNLKVNKNENGSNGSYILHLFVYYNDVIYYFCSSEIQNCILIATSKEADIVQPNSLVSERARKRARGEGRETETEKGEGGGVIKAPGLSPAHPEYVNVSEKTQQEKAEEERGEREEEEGSSVNDWVSDQGKESKRVRDGERALWIVSGLRHSVNRRCFCMRCQCTGLLQGIARSFASHIYRPCLPTSTSLQQPLPAGWENTPESKGVSETCEPQGMRAAS